MFRKDNEMLSILMEETVLSNSGAEWIRLGKNTLYGVRTEQRILEFFKLLKISYWILKKKNMGEKGKLLTHVLLGYFKQKAHCNSKPCLYFIVYAFKLEKINMGIRLWEQRKKSSQPLFFYFFWAHMLHWLRLCL